MMKILAFLAALLAGAYADAAPKPVAPPPIAATCDTLPAQFKAAKAGDAFALTGTCASLITLRDRSFAPAVTIDARGAALLGGVYIFNAGGIHVTGGQYGPQPSGGTGFSAYITTDVTLTAARVTGMDFGVTFARSQDVGITASRIDFIRNDGIRMFNVQRGAIAGNFILEAHPPTDANHPDGIQLASDGGAQNAALISSDITVAGNDIIGDGQGISAFQSGADDGGYDRVTITGNRVRTSYPQGLAIYGCRACAITGNDIGPLPLAPHTVQANVFNAVGGTVCGNRSQRMVEPATVACR